MFVDDAMTKTIHSCRPDDSLATAAKLLWDHDCGCVPVLDEHGHVQGMLTDRDICMAAYTTGRSLGDLTAGDVMTREVASVLPSESLQEAEIVMRKRGVRRLPVLDDQQRIIGLLSCNDLCRWVEDGRSNGVNGHDALHLVLTLAAIGRPRHGRPANATPASARPQPATQGLPFLPKRSLPGVAGQVGAVRMPSRAAHDKVQRSRESL